MTQDQTAGAVEEPTQREQDGAALEQLRQENQQLHLRIEALSERREQEEGLSEQLGQARRDNDQLRRRFAAAALNEAIARAAQAVGISPEAAGAYAHRFRCEVDPAGEVRVEPNPTELLLAELRENPLLRESARRRRQESQAGAVADGAAPVEQADPAELMASLDRSAARKARFIARHGAQSYLLLAARARGKGYGKR